MEDTDKIYRITVLILKLWNKFPSIRFGQLLELVSGKQSKVHLIVDRKNFMSSDARIDTIPADICSLTDEDWEMRMKGILDACDAKDTK